MSRLRIGEFLVSKGILVPAQVDEILNHSKSLGQRFGESAMDLGFLNERQMLKVFGPDYRVDFFHLRSEYFPKSTKDLFKTQDMIKFGFLPLGIKTSSRWLRKETLLNIGMLNPSSAASSAAVQTLFGELSGGHHFDKVKTYLVLADQFLDVLDKIYEIPPKEIFALSADERHPFFE